MQSSIPLIAPTSFPQPSSINSAVLLASSNPNPFPLHWAASKGYTSTLTTLLSSGYSPNTLNHLGQTPLHISISRRDLNFAQWLLSHPDIDVNQPDANGETPLSLATERENEAIFGLLAGRRDVDVNRVDRWGRCPLFVAVGKGNEKVVETLLSRNDINPNLMAVAQEEPEKGQRITAFYAAVKSGNLNMVKTFLRRSDLDLNLGLPVISAAVHWACNGFSKHGPEILGLILRRRDLDVNRCGGETSTYPALMEAIIQHDSEPLRFLLQRDDINLNFTSPLQFFTDYLEVMDFSKLCTAEPEFDSNGVKTSLISQMEVTPLQLALLIGREEAVELMAAKAGLNPNVGGCGIVLPVEVAVVCERQRGLEALRRRGDLRE